MIATLTFSAPEDGQTTGGRSAGAVPITDSAAALCDNPACGVVCRRPAVGPRGLRTPVELTSVGAIGCVALSGASVEPETETETETENCIHNTELKGHAQKEHLSRTKLPHTNYTSAKTGQTTELLEPELTRSRAH